MSTSRQFTLKRYLPHRFRITAEGYYDKVISRAVSGDTTENIELLPWPTPNLEYAESPYSPATVSVDNGYFQDYNIRKSDCKLLMPYDHGKLYRDAKVSMLNYNLENVGCTITNGVASGFSATNYLHIKNIALRGNWEICLKVNVGEIGSSERALFGQLSQNYHTPQIELSKSSLWLGLSSNGSSWDISSSSYAISPELQENSEHIIKLTFDGEKYQAFIDDTVIATINNSTPIYVDDNEFVIGVDANNTSFPGTVDLNNSHIIADNVTLWEYPQVVYIDTDMQGCLETASDGTAHTYTAYTIKDEQFNQRLLLSDSASGLSSYTFDESTLWTVPNGLTEIVVDCVGASGATGNGGAGKGGRVQCTMQVAAGEQYYINVGKTPTSNQVASYNASDIRTSQNELNSRVVVAGGGGSGGYAAGYHANTSSTGGDGGDLTADKGTDTVYYHGNAAGGNGGSQSAGGSGAEYGTLGLGGNGGNYYVLGGAGGAGYYGGGGGGAGLAKHDDHLYAHAAGGGGGSSYTNSSLCSSVTHTKGFRTGNGYITLTAANQGGTIFSSSNDLKAYKLSTISIPAHDTYTYTEESTVVPNNVTKVGDIELNESTGVLSNFGIGNYAQLPDVFVPQDKEWEFQIKFKRLSATSDERIFGLGGVIDYHGVTLAVSNNKTWWWVSTGKSSYWDLVAGGTGNTTLTTGTVFWVKVVYNKSNYTMYTSTNGVDWTVDYVLNRSEATSNTVPPTLGVADAPSRQSFNGEIYLGDCYLKLDNDIIWSGNHISIKGKWTKNT